MAAPWLDDVEVLDYDRARREALAAFDRLGYRSRSRAARDLGLAPAEISSVLKGRHRVPEHLEKLRLWLTQQPL